MKTITKSILLASTLAFGVSASHIYIVTQPGTGVNQIGTVDPLTGTVTGAQNTVSDGSAAGFGIASGTSLEFFDIAVNGLNEIYGVTRQAPSGSLAGIQQLWRLNGASGVAQLIAANLSGALSTINGLAFNPADGLLYLSGSSGTIYSTNLGGCALGGQFTQSCSFAAVNSVALPSNSRGDIEFHTVLGDPSPSLYLAGEDDKIYRLTGSGTSWTQAGASPGALTVNGGFFVLKGLASNGTDLYVGGDISGGHGIALVNPTALTISGFQNFTGVSNFVAGLGANSTAVPEPSVFLLSSIGLGMIAFARRKKKSS